MSAPPLTTITLCSYVGAQRFWAFNQMGGSRRDLSRVPGLRFWKLLGTGHGSGFSLRPDFSRYGLFAVWESHEAADEFFETSRLMSQYRERAGEMWTLRMLPTQAHGAWSRGNPFTPLAPPPPPGGPVAVLTRATIRLNRLTRFWRAVPATSRALDRARGLLASIGTGEMPFIRPATFSLWRSEADMQAFAYADDDHREVIRRRREEGWYKEEMFARFAPLSSEGTWNGRNPLGGMTARKA